MDDRYYDQIDRQADRLFAEEKHAEALALLDNALEQFPDHELDIRIYQAVARAVLNDFSAAFDVLSQTVARGFSVPLHWRIFQPLKEREDFAALNEINQRLLERDRKGNHMQYAVHLPPRYDPARPTPLFMVLHGDGVDGNLSWLQWQWQPGAMLERGFMTAYVQSSQALMTGRFGWLPDPFTARHDLLDCYHRLQAEYPVDPEQVYIGGFSGGAITAVDISFAAVLPVRGFVALCPEWKPAGFTPENVTAAAARGLRGVILEGEQTYPTSDEADMLAVLDDRAFPYQLMINPGIGHAVPLDFQQKLGDALDYLTR